MRRFASLLLTYVMVAEAFCSSVVSIKAKEPVESIISGMTTEQKIAQMIIPSLRTWNNKDTTVLNSEQAAALKKYDFAGVILFSQNTKNVTKTTELINSIQDAHSNGGFKDSMFVAVDQEGGRVTRLQTGTHMPGNMAVAATGDVTNAYKAATVIGKELAVQGFNLDFAPVVDVNSNPANPVIGVRSFSDKPEIVTQYGLNYVNGLHDQKVMTCLKHFPGHGDTDVDSHTGLPKIDKTYDELLKSELIPFSSLAAATDFIMTAHIQFPQIEKETCISKASGQKIYLPATLSKMFLTDILRKKLGYQGLIITDSMEMDAISTNFDKLDASARAINAGADILLMPVRLTSTKDIADLDAYIKGLGDMVRSGAISENRINESVTRILRTKEKYGLLDKVQKASPKNAASIVGSKELKAVEWEIAQKAATATKNDGVFPIGKDKKVVIFYPKKEELNSIKAGVKKAGINKVDYIFDGEGVSSSADSSIQNADVVICISSCATGGELKNTATVDTLIEKAKNNGKKTLVLSTNLPYDLQKFNNADALVACYGPGVNITAAIYKIFLG
ncbi:beta-N-acetylhexosaminidase [Butyrivibrio hungatei]|uniref:beta-N-acetylhexosaminidase n=1 Tax=Butyrivibrio hungatei TaxID=185008 RepID=A0A1G5EP91_9FIRM|nr:glycoside hydrolase family 3 protein [Butyrivibrio hungatei]SCY28813.1 beta-N-acetylhexosaminidase [Butyrivibrio hungatei]